jgi:hypothetical protein
MAERPDPPMAAAMQWVARVFAVALVMFLPGVGGQWVDRKLGTAVLGPLGFVVGLVVGTWYLIAATRGNGTRRR